MRACPTRPTGNSGSPLASHHPALYRPPTHGGFPGSPRIANGQPDQRPPRPIAGNWSPSTSPSPPWPRTTWPKSISAASSEERRHPQRIPAQEGAASAQGRNHRRPRLRRAGPRPGPEPQGQRLQRHHRRPRLHPRQGRRLEARQGPLLHRRSGQARHRPALISCPTPARPPSGRSSSRTSPRARPSASRTASPSSTARCSRSIRPRASTSSWPPPRARA
jgi:hypothetical protein